MLLGTRGSRRKINTPFSKWIRVKPALALFSASGDANKEAFTFDPAALKLFALLSSSTFVAPIFPLPFSFFPPRTQFFLIVRGSAAQFDFRVRALKICAPLFGAGPFYLSFLMCCRAGRTSPFHPAPLVMDTGKLLSLSSLPTMYEAHGGAMDSVISCWLCIA